MVDYVKLREDLHKRFSKAFEKLAEYERLHEPVNSLQKDVYEKFHRELDRLNGVKREKRWKCPIDFPDCTKNCGSYGCGN
jgi:hypothetical protein